MTPKRKAVSPIIATILLVVIALILVGILLSWGQNFIQRSTSDADNAIDRKCIGADIEFKYCSYNSTDKNLVLIIANTGKIDFEADTNLSLILIDDDKTLYNDETDILVQEAFPVGASQRVEIDLADEELVSPIDVEIRSSQCTNFFKRVTCR